MTKKPKKAPVSDFQAEADAILHLIREAKKQGVSFFKGPRGIEFGFRRESLKIDENTHTSLPREVGDDFIP